MAKQTATIVPGEVSQSAWETAFTATTKKLKDMGGGQTTDNLTEGAIKKYDTGPPPETTDDLTEGSTNKYDTGVPPASQDDLPDGAIAKQYLVAERTKLAGIEAEATADQTGEEVRDAIVAIDEGDRKIVVTNPAVGEYKVLSVKRSAGGDFAYDFDDVPIE